MTETIKACSTCSHFQESEDRMFSTCNNWQTCSYDYIGGKVHCQYIKCILARKNEDLCGHTAKGYIPVNSISDE
jgi:hypothetical protein